MPIFLPNNDKIELKQPVSQLASILPGKLVAIQMNLFHIEEKKLTDIGIVLIFCDSQSADGILQLGWTIKDIRNKKEKV